MTKYEEHRTFLQGIIDAMARTESDLVARLDEIRNQKSMVEDAVQALNVYEHINTTKE